ncbi:hypothetical protein ACHAW6_011472 [Cyclotella cf. meneghiniana]
MILLPILHVLTAVFTADAFKHLDRHRHLGKKEERESNPPTSLPTISPTVIPTSPPIMQEKHSPMTPQENSNPLGEICDKKDAEKLDICAEWFEPSTAPSAVPSTTASTAIILSSTSSTETQTVYTEHPTSKPTKNVHFDASDTSEVKDSSSNGRRGRIEVELCYFDMIITIYSKSEPLRKSNEASDSDSESIFLTRQFEHAAVREHLHEVYRKSFTNPMSTLNLTFIDTGESKTYDRIIQRTTFFGCVVFERVEGNPDPTPADLEKVTSRAFADDDKRNFLDKLDKNNTAIYTDVASHDVIVQKLAQIIEINSMVGGSEASPLKDKDKTKDVLRIVGMIAGAFTICAVFTIIARRKKRMHQFIQQKNAFGGFEAHGNVVHGFGGSNINDAYMDSASITSRSVGESVLRLNTPEETVDSLRELRLDVEIVIPMSVCSEGDCSVNSEIR